jgi:hypothetical protein
MQMTTNGKRPAAFDAVKAEMMSMIPFAFKGMVKPYITDEIVLKIVAAALGAGKTLDRFEPARDMPNRGVDAGEPCCREITR